MLENAGWFAVALIVVFLINLVPAMMPSSWMVLAFFAIKFDLPIVPLGAAGAVVSGCGRYFLSRGSDLLTRTVFKRKAEDLRALGALLEQRRQALPLVVFFYSLTPLPTNNLFVAAGMTGVSLLRVLIGFWLARIPADIFWMWTAHTSFANLEEVFRRSGTGLGIALQVGALSSVLLLYVLPWGRWLRKYLEKHGGKENHAADGADQKRMEAFHGRH